MKDYWCWIALALAFAFALESCWLSAQLEGAQQYLPTEEAR